MLASIPFLHSISNFPLIVTLGSRHEAYYIKSFQVRATHSPTQTLPLARDSPAAIHYRSAVADAEQGGRASRHDVDILQQPLRAAQGRVAMQGKLKWETLSRWTSTCQHERHPTG